MKRHKGFETRSESKESLEFVAFRWGPFCFSKVLCIFIVIRVTYFCTWGGCVGLLTRQDPDVCTASKQAGRRVTRLPRYIFERARQRNAPSFLSSTYRTITL